MGRTALWWCLGLGMGMVLGELVNLIVRGSLGLPDAADASLPVATALTLWPWGLALASAALLLAGMRPAMRIEVDRRTAARLHRTGAPAIASVLQVSEPSPGPRAALDVTLLVLTRTGRMYTTDVHWTLDPVDAGTLRKRAVVPVRIDPSSPHCAALDTLADSRVHTAGMDVAAAFSTRRRFQRTVTRTRPSSRVAVLVGTLAGLLIVVL